MFRISFAEVRVGLIVKVKTKATTQHIVLRFKMNIEVAVPFKMRS